MRTTEFFDSFGGKGEDMLPAVIGVFFSCKNAVFRETIDVSAYGRFGKMQIVCDVVLRSLTFAVKGEEYEKLREADIAEFL